MVAEVKPQSQTESQDQAQKYTVAQLAIATESDAEAFLNSIRHTLKRQYSIDKPALNTVLPADFVTKILSAREAIARSQGTKMIGAKMEADAIGQDTDLSEPEKEQQLSAIVKGAKVSLSEIKRIAQGNNVPQVVIKQMSDAMFARQQQLLFLKGKSDRDRERANEQAGRLVSDLAYLVEKNSELDALEADINGQDYSLVNLAKGYGIDINGALENLATRVEKQEQEREATIATSKGIVTGENPAASEVTPDFFTLAIASINATFEGLKG